MKNIKLFTTILLTAFVFIASANADGLKVLHKKTFQVNAGETFKLESDAGDVVIKTSDGNEVTVTIFGNAKAEDKMEFELSKTNFGVFVSGKKSGSFFSNLFSALKNVRIKYEVQVPKKFNADVSTAGGDVKINDLEGTLDLSTAGGDIAVQSSNGKAHASTAGGDIKFKMHSGEVDANTAGGDIYIDTRDGKIDASTAGGDIKIYCSNGNVDASTTGGDVYAEISGENKGIDLSSIGGDIYLGLSENMNGEIELSTFGGDATLDIEGTKNLKTSSSKIKATLNNGGKKIHLSSTGGDVKLANLKVKS